MLVQRRHPVAGDVTVGDVPWKFSETPVTYGNLCPPLGQDTEEVLAALNREPQPLAIGPANEPDRQESAGMTSPLERYLVIDMTQGDSGPFCTMQLGDAGAEVIKVEPLEGDPARRLGPPFVDGDSGFFMGLNRNKKSLAVDFETPDGREIVHRLAQRADVFVESFTPGEIERLGFDFASLSARNPRLVYCAISAFGQQGPYAHKPATDLVVEGISGIQRFLGVAGEEPVKMGTNYAGAVADMYAMQGILAALFWRRSSGRGQKVETSMLAAMLSTQTNYFTSDSDPDVRKPGFLTTFSNPPATGFQTKDIPIFLNFLFARLGAWERFCHSVGISEDVTGDPRFATEEGRQAHEQVLKPIYEKAFATLTADEVLQRLGISAAAVADKVRHLVG